MTKLLCFHLAACSLHAQVEFNSGDSIAILGNALPDRSQHFGWLETLLTQAITIQNLDETTSSLRGVGRAGVSGWEDDSPHRSVALLRADP